MASYNKFNLTTQNMMKAVMNFNTDTVKVVLSNTLPVSTNAVLADITQIGAGNGYSTGGTASSISIANASGVEKITATDVVFTASGGTIGPFRYIVVYDDTPTSPTDPLIAWFDYGSAITLNDGETFTVDFDGTNGLFTVT